MKKKSLLLILLMALIAPWAAKGQTPTPLLEENFNSMSSIATSYSATDWYAYNAGSGNNWTLNSSSGVSSSKCAQYKYNSSFAANCYLVSTPFDVNAQMEELSVSLYEKTASSYYNETFEVFFVKASDVTDNASITSATKYMVIASASYANNTSYAEQTGSNDNSALAGQSVRLVVHCTSAKDQHTLYIDDITVTQTIASSCEKPATLVADPVTANSATLTWTGGSGTYNVEYKKASDADWTVALTNTTLLTTNLSLEPATTYEARVQSVCTSENSGWKTVDFTTECGIISTFPKSYGFETSEGFPSNASTPTTNQLGVCWRNEATVQSGSYADRVWGTSTSYKKYGSQSLVLPDKGNGSKTMLVFPEMNFTSANGYVVSFWIYRGTTGSNPEGFKVYISDTDTISTNAVFLGHYSRYYDIAYPKIESTYGWYNYEIEIPQATMTGNVHLIFEGQSYYGSATYVDDVKIEVAPTCKKPSGLTCDSKTVHTATLSWTNGEATQDAWQIAYSTSSTFAPADNFTPGEGEGLADVTTNPGTIGGLAQSTTYYAYVRANCGGGDYSPWSNAKVSFSTISGKQKPTNLAVLNSTITSDQARVVWKGVATNELHESFEVYYSRLSTKPDPLEADSLIVVSGAVDTTYLFTNLDAEQKYYVWVRDKCGTDGYSDWTSSINFTTASACETPTGVNAIEVTQTTAKISWNTYGLTEFNLRFKQKDAADWNPTIEGITCPYTITTNLEPNTEYLVQVQGTCAATDEWSASGSFTTECGPISVATEAYQYDFETNLKWNCWTVPTGSGSSAINNSSSNAHNGDKYLRFTGSYRNIVILPEFEEATSTLQLNYWTRPENISNSSCGTFDVGYVTSLTDTSTFVKIERYKYNDWETSTYLEKTIYFDSAPDGAYIAFRHNANATNYWWYVDDVEVSVAPLCRPVKDLAYSNVTNHSATITWTKGTEDQDTWQLKYNKEDDFDPDTEGTLVDNLDATTYTFNKTLDATSVYYIYVRANCGGAAGNSPWTKTVISTETSAPAPSTFAKTEVGPNWVDLYWNKPAGDYLSGYGIYYSTSSTAPEATAEATVTINDPTAPTSAAPYRLTGLTNETTYYLWVRANHETDVYSEWKAITGSSITTLVACPAPTALAAKNITHTTADLTWTGYSDSYTVEYQTSAYQQTVFFDDFENGIGEWTVVTEGEGPGWELSSDDYYSSSHSMLAFSYDYSTYVAYDADNWLISPQITMGKTLKFFAIQNYSDQYTVLFSSTNDISSFTTVLKAKATAPSSWTEVTVDLSSVEGQTGYIAIHHEKYNGGYLAIDDFGIYGDEVPAGGWAEATTSATDGAYTIEGLTAGTKYDVRVKGNCGGEYSDVKTFTTIDDNTKIFKTAGNWNVAGNWDGGIPNGDNDVLIRANARIPAGTNATAKNITIEGTPTPTLTIADGGTLMHRNTGVTATIEKNITGYGEGNDKWYLISTSLWDNILSSNFSTQAQNLIATTASDYDLFRFSGTSEKEWLNYKHNSFNLYSGCGYLYANKNDVTLKFTEKLSPAYQGVDYANYTGANPGTLSYDQTKPFGTFNLIGNSFPYPVLLYFEKDDVISPIEDFYVMNAAGTEVEVSENDRLGVNQGAFIVSTEENQYAKLATYDLLASKAQSSSLNIRLSNDQNNIDFARIRFGEGYGLDKYQLNAEHTKLYIPQDGKDFAVTYKEAAEGVMPLNFKAETTGKYNISFKLDGANLGYLHLYDKITGEDVNLFTTPEYSFVGSPRDMEDRFIIRFSESSFNETFAYQNGDEIIVNGEGTLQVFDVMGRFVTSMEVNGSERISAKQYSNAVYIFRLVGNDVKTQKIVVR